MENTEKQMSPRLSDRQTVYSLFFLRRLAGAPQDDMSRLSELEASLDEARAHSARAFSQGDERAVAEADAEIAAAVVRDMLAQPGFDIAAGIARLEAQRVGRNTTRQAPQPTQLQPAPVPAPPAQPLVAAAAPLPLPAPHSLRKVGIAAAVAGALAGAAVGYLMRAPAPPSIAAAIGDWRWEGGAKVSLGGDGRFLFNDRLAGYFFAATDRDFVMVHGQGRFVDYVSLSADGARLTGYSAAGVALNATRLR
jgi:hypothetical protein